MEDKRFQNPKISFLEQNNCIDFAIRLMAKEIAKSIVADESNIKLNRKQKGEQKNETYIH